MRNKEHHISFFPPSRIRVITTRRLRKVQHVECKAKIRNEYRIPTIILNLRKEDIFGQVLLNKE
jgi:hypothetical protein